VAGALVGYSQGQLSTGSFEVDTGILLFAIAFFAGITSIGGAALAAAIAPLGFVFVLLNDHNSGKWYSAIAGIGLIITVMVRRHCRKDRRAVSASDGSVWAKPNKAEPPASPPAATEATDVSGPQAVGRGA
jgi:hypothetical protein